MRVSRTEYLIDAARRLRAAAERLHFAAPVFRVYNPLRYAWAPHEMYVRKYGASTKQVLFLGMNPGPFGMTQTGVPFGEVAAVRDWLGITGEVKQPTAVHPKRPILGFGCPRSEISGRRLWGLFASRFGSADRFFKAHFVLNYCPLAFLEATGRNLTPDHLPAHERLALFQACDDHLRAAVSALQPGWLIGVGDFAFKRAREVFPNGSPKLGRILHPSPASPAANRDWTAVVTRQLGALSVW